MTPTPENGSLVHFVRSQNLCVEGQVSGFCHKDNCGQLAILLPDVYPEISTYVFDAARSIGTWHEPEDCPHSLILFNDPETWHVARTNYLQRAVSSVIQFGDFTLSSGAKSNFYFDARLVTLDQWSSKFIGSETALLARDLGATAVGGPATAACPIVTACGLVAALELSHTLKLFYSRSEAKKHGTKKLLEGPALSETDRVLVVDDVVTSGASIMKVVDEIRRGSKAAVVGVWTLLDRQQGGRELLKQEGIELTAMFEAADFKAKDKSCQ